MPAEPFSVHVDQDDLAKLDLAAALSSPAPADGGGGDRPRTAAVDAAHHGAHDDRQAARSRSDQVRAARAAGSALGRTYAFRRS